LARLIDVVVCTDKVLYLLGGALLCKARRLCRSAADDFVERAVDDYVEALCTEAEWTSATRIKVGRYAFFFKQAVCRSIIWLFY
jgi:hypothetical protein